MIGAGMPIGDRRDLLSSVLWVRLTLVPLAHVHRARILVRKRSMIANKNASTGHWRAQVAVTHPPRALQVQHLPDALRCARK